MPTELLPNARNHNYPMAISGYPREGLFTESPTQLYHLGTRYQDEEGNVYYYAKAGGALAAGTLIESAALGGAATTAQEDLAVATSSSAGDYFGYATILTTAQVGGLFNEGYYIVGAGTAGQGRGQIYKIKNDDTAEGVAGALTVGSHKFTFYRPCRTAITAGSAVVRLIVNPYKNVTTAASTPVGGALGIAPIAVTSGYYFWLQTYGVCSALTAGAMTVGTAVVRAVAVAGAVGPQIAGTSSVITEVVGYALATIDDTDNGPIMLTIRG